MRIVVTGGASFIGANFAHTLLEGHADVDVIVLDKFTYTGNRGSLSDITEEQAKRLRIAEEDIADAGLVGSVVVGSDAVVHFVAKSHNDNSLSNPSPFIMTNLVDTFTLLEAMRHHKVHFHHISTDEVYDDLELDDPARFAPSTPYNPSPPYSSSKADPDLLVHAWVRSFGIEATISNCSSNYSPYQRIEKFISHIITSRLHDVRPCLYKDGLNVRDWIHVRDHNTAVWEILIGGRIGGTYLIGADGETNNRDITMILNELMGCAPDNFSYVADRPDHDLRYAIDNTKLCKELDWSLRSADFRSGLADIIERYTCNEAQWAPLKKAVKTKYAAERH